MFKRYASSVSKLFHMRKVNFLRITNWVEETLTKLSFILTLAAHNQVWVVMRITPWFLFIEPSQWPSCQPTVWHSHLEFRRPILLIRCWYHYTFGYSQDSLYIYRRNKWNVSNSFIVLTKILSNLIKKRKLFWSNTTTRQNFY